MNTLEDIVRSAKKVEMKTGGAAPLPIEASQAHTVKNELFTNLAEFKQLDLEYTRMTYFDQKFGRELPKFATLNVSETDGKLVVVKREFAVDKESELINDQVWIFRSDKERVLNQGFLRVKICTGNKTGVWPDRYWYEKALEFSFQFIGAIPEKTRQLYHQHKNKFDDVWLICDAQNQWSCRPVPNRDPIMVGAKWVNGKPYLFVIDVFDLTLSEQYIKDEFTT